MNFLAFLDRPGFVDFLAVLDESEPVFLRIFVFFSHFLTGRDL